MWRLTWPRVIADTPLHPRCLVKEYLTYEQRVAATCAKGLHILDSLLSQTMSCWRIAIAECNKATGAASVRAVGSGPLGKHDLRERCGFRKVSRQVDSPKLSNDFTAFSNEFLTLRKTKQLDRDQSTLGDVGI